MLKKGLIVVGIILAAAIGYIVYVSVTSPPIPTSPIPKITNIDFPEKINLNEEVQATVEFEDGDGDVVQLISNELDKATHEIMDLTEAGVAGMYTGSFSLTQQVASPQIVLNRLILVDAKGNRSEPY
ncbi:MAG: hypothetical protein AAB686_02355, partial [Patescibacteria group bacterium]